MALAILPQLSPTAAELPTPELIKAEIRTIEIRQDEILEVMNLRNEVAKLQADLEERELSLKARLDMGCSVEPGPRSASLKITERRNVAWKAVVERELGAGYAANVLSHTKPNQIVSLVLI